MESFEGLQRVMVTCGKLKGTLLLNKFYCPAIHCACIELDGQVITPKMFCIKGDKERLKDWKNAIRIQGVPLRKLIETGQLDFHRHDEFCTGRCTARNPINRNANISSVVPEANATTVTPPAGCPTPSATFSSSKMWRSNQAQDRPVDIAETLYRRLVCPGPQECCEEGDNSEPRNTNSSVKEEVAHEGTSPAPYVPTPRLASASKSKLSSVERNKPRISSSRYHKRSSGSISFEESDEDIETVTVTYMQLSDDQQFWLGIVENNLCDDFFHHIHQALDNIKSDLITYCVREKDAYSLSNIVRELGLMAKLKDKLTALKSHADQQQLALETEMQELKKKMAKYKADKKALKRKSRKFDHLIAVSQSKKRRVVQVVHDHEDTLLSDSLSDKSSVSSSDDAQVEDDLPEKQQRPQMQRAGGGSKKDGCLENGGDSFTSSDVAKSLEKGSTALDAEQHLQNIADSSLTMATKTVKAASPATEAVGCLQTSDQIYYERGNGQSHDTNPCTMDMSEGEWCTKEEMSQRNVTESGRSEEAAGVWENRMKTSSSKHGVDGSQHPHCSGVTCALQNVETNNSVTSALENVETNSGVTSALENVETNSSVTSALENVETNFRVEKEDMPTKMDAPSAVEMQSIKSEPDDHSTSENPEASSQSSSDNDCVEADGTDTGSTGVCSGKFSETADTDRQSANATTAVEQATDRQSANATTAVEQAQSHLCSDTSPRSVGTTEGAQSEDLNQISNTKSDASDKLAEASSLLAKSSSPGLSSSQALGKSAASGNVPKLRFCRLCGRERGTCIHAGVRAGKALSKALRKARSVLCKRRRDVMNGRRMPTADHQQHQVKSELQLRPHDSSSLTNPQPSAENIPLEVSENTAETSEECRSHPSCKSGDLRAVSGCESPSFCVSTDLNGMAPQVTDATHTMPAASKWRAGTADSRVEQEWRAGTADSPVELEMGDVSLCPSASHCEEAAFSDLAKPISEADLSVDSSSETPLEPDKCSTQTTKGKLRATETSTAPVATTLTTVQKHRTEMKDSIECAENEVPVTIWLPSQGSVPVAVVSDENMSVVTTPAVRVFSGSMPAVSAQICARKPQPRVYVSLLSKPAKVEDSKKSDCSATKSSTLTGVPGLPEEVKIPSLPRSLSSVHSGRRLNESQGGTTHADWSISTETDHNVQVHLISHSDKCSRKPEQLAKKVGLADTGPVPETLTANVISAQVLVNMDERQDKDAVPQIGPTKSGHELLLAEPGGRESAGSLGRRLDPAMEGSRDDTPLGARRSARRQPQLPAKYRGDLFLLPKKYSSAGTSSSGYEDIDRLNNRK